MTVYLAIIISSLLLGFLINKEKIYKNRPLYIFLWIIIFLLLTITAAIRYKVGTDYSYTYQKIYYQYINNYSNIRMDIAMKFLYKLIIFLNLHYQWIFVITSIIINFIIIKAIIKLSENSMISLIIFLAGGFYFFAMNGIRQAIAISLFYYSLIYLKQKNVKKYFIANLIGFLFHSSAIIFFPLYFFLDKKIKKKYLLLFSILFILTSSFLTPYLINIILKTKYALYVNGSTDYVASNSINLSTIINFMIFLCFLFVKPKNKQDKDYNIYINLHFISLISSIFILHIPLANRIFLSFRHIQIFSVPYLINNISKNKKWFKRIFTILIIILYLLYFYISVGIQNHDGVLPYQTIYNN